MFPASGGLKLARRSEPSGLNVDPIQTCVVDAPELPNPEPQMDQTELPGLQMNWAWVVLSSVGTGPQGTAPQPPGQKWYHLTVQGPKVHLGAIDQVRDQNREGPSLTHKTLLDEV